MPKKQRHALSAAEVIDKLKPNIAFEFHASEFFAGARMFAGTDEGYRRGIAKQISDIYEKHECSFVGSWLNKARHKAKYGQNAWAPNRVTMMCLLERLESLLSERKGERHRHLRR